MDTATLQQQDAMNGAGSLQLHAVSADAHSHIPPALPTVLRKIPRPPNAFILYRSNKMRELKNPKNTSVLADKGLDKLDYQRQLSKVIGQLWRDESAEVKAIFYEKAQQAAREHKERYPEYRFKPAVKKAASIEPEIPPPSAVAVAAADCTPEKRGDTDFSPGDLSGPLSGSGSGSGRKRASLEGARSKASPYSASRHRRTSSTGPSSPTAHRANSSMSQQNPPVLLYAAYDPAHFAGSGVPLTRSVSFGASSHRSNQRRTAKPAARRSLDGQVSQTATINNSFDTLVPHHLRDTRVFLAPHPQPPLPVGYAITTDEPSTAHAPHYHQQREHKPRRSLFDAVKSALPPERRAFLQESLAMKGFSYAVQAHPPARVGSGSTANHFEAPLAQSESWTSIISTDSADTWQSQAATSNPSSQSSYATAQSELPPNLDPAYQEALDTNSYAGPSVNLHMSASTGANYPGIGDWSQPDPCWLDYSQSQSSSSSNVAPPPHFHSEAYHGQTVAEGQSQQSSSAQCDSKPHYAQPVPTFGSVDLSQYVPSDYEINSHNSAFVALSEPDSTGQVQGHFYGLDGQLIGQGAVAGTEPGQDGRDEYLDEEARQRRAVDQLLMQMMTASDQSSSAFDCPLHPDPIDAGASQGQVEPQEPLSCAYDQAQWQSWSQGSGLKLEDNLELGDNQAAMPEPSSQAGSEVARDAQQGLPPNAFEAHSPSVVLVPTSQEWMDASNHSQEQAQLTSPRTSRNFSRPMIYDASPQDYRQQSTTSTNSTSSPSNATGQLHQGEAHAQPATIDPAQLTRRPKQEQHSPSGLPSQQHQAKESQAQSVQQSLRNWKSNRLNSFRDKLTRVRHKATPSTSSLSVDQAKDGS
ncbi:probable HMG-box protein Hmg3 [Sporisorium reilianum f. sp. reilianum]|uniref:Probable HMG-box protein Hmg3 n=1 Tax=Sporisorium reilianum f. sp. reilianum TaxID=72559 RepID=A0A2N8U8Z2_9BASI|nr:probable HMG-box protein Hmg3 [Sporisorium reilianum f. sp. reilianum]